VKTVPKLPKSVFENKLWKLSFWLLNFEVSSVRFGFRKLISDIFIWFCTPLAVIRYFQSMVLPTVQ